MKPLLRSFGLGFCCFLLLCMAPAAVFGKDINLFAGLGFEFATGTYGTDQTTNSYSIPLTIRYDPTERFSLELVVPYVFLSNGSTSSAGMFRFGNGRAGSSANGFGSNGNGQTGAGQTSTDSRSQSGVGDVSLKAGYVVWPEGASSPQIKPLLYVQFPTADKDKGLGSGVFSGGGGLEITKWFGGWHTYAEGLYVFQETAAELSLKNYVSYEAGVGFQVTDRFRPTILLMGATAPSDYSSSLAEARIKASYRLTGRASLEGYLGAGLTSQSSDFGAGIAFFYEF
jgi:hypothetical protein